MIFDNILLGTKDDDLLEDAQLPGTSLLKGFGGNDTINSSSGQSRIEAGNGDDEIMSAGGWILDGAGNDFIEAYGTSKFFIRNGGGDDFFTNYGGPAAEADIIIVDGQGSDTYQIQSNGHAVYIYADVTDPAGNDVYAAEGYSAATISYAHTTLGIKLYLNGYAEGSEIGEDEIGGFNRAVGGTGDDILVASEENCTLIGGDGADRLEGLQGDDRLHGGAGNDNIFDYGGVANIRSGSGDNNIIISVTGGRIVLGDGSNILDITDETVVPDGTFIVVLNSLDNVIDATNADETIIVRGEGLATIDIKENGTIVSFHDLHNFAGSLTTTNETVILKLRGDYFVNLQNDQYSGIDRVVTGSGKQWAIGNTSAYNAFETGSGDDDITCKAALTIVDAGKGDDVVTGGSGASTIDMGTGLDRVFCSTGTETIKFDSDGSDMPGKAFTNVFRFTYGTDRIMLEAGADTDAFLNLGRDVNVSGIDGVQFDTAAGDTLFIADLSIATITAADLFV